MDLSIAVIVATKGRPRVVSQLLHNLALQTVAPDILIVSACDSADVEPEDVQAPNVKVVFGPPGLTAQRNRALALVQGKYDLVVFFDDDFIPSRFWVERIRLLFATQTDVGTVTGRVLADGVTSGGLQWAEGEAIVNKADADRETATASNYRMHPDTPYGCNMAFRLKTIDGLTFDERLALYGWLEDLDFGLRAGARARMISTDFVWGVHLGARAGRDSGVRFGYSQVVNPWYLMKKELIGRVDALRRISRGFAGNAVMAAAPYRSHVDRVGRLKGNIIGIRDIIRGKWAPENVIGLS